MGVFHFQPTKMEVEADLGGCGRKVYFELK